MDRNVKWMNQYLLICDAENQLARTYGIIGGENSMITDSVKTVCSAYLTRRNDIRLSSKRVGLRTDASGSLKRDWICKQCETPQSTVRAS